MNEILNKHSRLFTCLFFILIVFLLFYRLDARTFRLWDEARLAVNAACMFIDGHYLYTSYLTAPDFWNTKPHLLILLQVLSMKVFGFTEGSVRLPSAVATLLSCGLIYHWVRKENYTVFYACLATLAFICTRFLSFHGARAGDYEALLILWELSYCYAIFAYIQTQRLHFLWLGFIALTLAVLTKGIAGLLFAPGILIFVLLKNKLNLFLTCKSFYLGLLLFVCCIVGYYWLHELLTPGYLHNVYINEIGGRYFKTSEGHQASTWFYFQLFSLTYFYFLPIWLLGIAHLFFNRTAWYRNVFLQYIVIVSLTFFLVIYFSKTQLAWYGYPLYPFVGISVAILSHELAKMLKPSYSEKWLKFVAAWMVIAYLSAVIAMLASTRESPNVASFIKNNLPRNTTPRDYKVIGNDANQYDASLDFQREKYFAATQHHITKASFDQVRAGDWLIMRNDQVGKIHFAVEIENNPKDKFFGIYHIGLKS